MILYLHNEEEDADLCEWLFSHAGEPGYPDGTQAAADWLATVRPASYPHRVEVPPHLLEAIENILEDWGEVLTAHRETLESRLEVSP